MLSEMDKLTPEIMKQIEAAAKASCIQSGIAETVDGTLGKNKNPEFEKCVDKRVKDAVREARRGRLKNWFGNVNQYIQQQGGVLGLFDKLGSISESIRGGQTTMSGSETEVPTTPESDKNKDISSSNKIGVWVAVILLLALIGLLIFVLVKKPKTEA